LLDLFGKIISEKITKTEVVTVFKLDDFYVAVTKELKMNSVIEVNTLLSREELRFYLSY